MNTQEKIDLYVKGELPEEEIDGLWMDIANDPELLETLELEATVRAAIIEKYAAPTKINKVPRWPWYASAAAVLLVAMIQIFRIDSPQELGDFLAQDINYNQIESSTAYRNTEALSGMDSLLSAGAQLLNENKTAEAKSLFESFSSDDDSLNYAIAQLNLGIINYSSEDFSGAESNFMEAASFGSDSKRVQEKSYWLLSNSLVKQNKLEDAKSVLVKAYEIGGVFNNDIYLLKRKLDSDSGNQ